MSAQQSVPPAGTDYSAYQAYYVYGYPTYWPQQAQSVTAQAQGGTTSTTPSLQSTTHPSATPTIGQISSTSAATGTTSLPSAPGYDYQYYSAYYGYPGQYASANPAMSSYAYSQYYSSAVRPIATPVPTTKPPQPTQLASTATAGTPASSSYPPPGNLSTSNPPSSALPAPPPAAPVPSPPSPPPPEQPPPRWPPALRVYVERAFATCTNDDERSAMEGVLKDIITSAIASHTLYLTDWEKQPLPALPTTAAAAASAKKRKPLSDDFVRTEHRPKRVQPPPPRARTPPPYAPPATAAASSGGAEDWWDLLTVKGTCQQLEKAYFRLTSAPDPSTVRPEGVLRKALAMLKDKWCCRPDYLYTCEQLKSIRQDLTVQRIKNEFTVEVYETHARLALEVGDVSEFNQCQTQLIDLYALLAVGHIGEFTAYRMLYYLFANAETDLTKLMTELTAQLRAHPAVAHALKVRQAVALNNFCAFFRLYETVPNMGGYLMDLIVDKMRVAALKVMAKAHRTPVPLDWLGMHLGFDSLSQCMEYLSERGAVLSADSSELDFKASAAVFVTLTPEL